MNWVSGLVLFILLWWVSLFAVLPIGTHAVETPDEATGWRGAPAAPKLWRKALITTIVACVLWLAAYALITSNLISFREGVFAAPRDRLF
jgi:predicted secreted protein